MDRRESILQAIEAALETVPGFNVFRNKDQIPEGQRPALTLMDGDEQVSSANNYNSGKRDPRTPVVMIMSPEVFVTLKLPNANTDDLGTRLNTARAQILLAITGSTALRSHTVNGAISLRSVQTDLARGREVRGEMLLQFEIVYLLRFTDLAAT